LYSLSMDPSVMIYHSKTDIKLNQPAYGNNVSLTPLKMNRIYRISQH
jgi:hypothetical protein